MNSTAYAPATTRLDNTMQNTAGNQPYGEAGTSVPSQAQADQAKVNERGHFNQVTQRWEGAGERPEIPTDQSASTMPGGSDASSAKPSFKEQINGYAKKFAGQVTGKPGGDLPNSSSPARARASQEHEVAQGDALLAGQSKAQAEQAAERAKQS
ncbi:hypothetical protein JCM5296_007595 [Sporobolomyces johnsonii]